MEYTPLYSLSCSSRSYKVVFRLQYKIQLQKHAPIRVFEQNQLKKNLNFNLVLGMCSMRKTTVVEGWLTFFTNPKHRMIRTCFHILCAAGVDFFIWFVYGYKMDEAYYRDEYHFMNLMISSFAFHLFLMQVFVNFRRRKAHAGFKTIKHLNLV